MPPADRTHPDGVEIRPLRTQRELRDCVALQRATWGDDFDETVPPSILKVAQRIGGLAAGAFDPTGELLGFVFGMSGIEDGRPIHWSDMLAVRADARGLGLGRRLKEYQREYLLGLGVETIYWSFDPLVARNAQLNLARLGAEVVEYVPAMYGESTSVLHAGLGTDRFVVIWRIGAGARRRPPPGTAESSGTVLAAPVVNPVPGEDRAEPLDAGAVRIQIPRDIHAVLSADPGVAAAWRRSTRAAFLHYLGRGYRVADFACAAGAACCHYLLVRARSPEEVG